MRTVSDSLLLVDDTLFSTIGVELLYFVFNKIAVQDKQIFFI